MSDAELFDPKPQALPTKGSLLYAVQAAYRKHHLGDESIGWDELSNILLDAPCNEMGDREFQSGSEK